MRNSFKQSASEALSFEDETGTIASTAIYLVHSPRRTPDTLLSGWSYCYFKRFIDIAGSALLLVLLFVPGLIIAAAILATSKGPVFYREERIGRYGKPFRIWKFRSMYTDSERRKRIADVGARATALDEWRMRKGGHDPRITNVGRFIRKWSIDEFPQLINVLLGEMSLIGPRPIVHSEVKFYGDLYVYYLAATPGLSGLWQVSGRSRIGYEERAELDASYVKAWSLKSDMSILFRTFPAVINRVGAY